MSDMKTVRTSELIGAPLDWAVDAVVSGKPLEVRHHKSGNGDWAFFHDGIPYQQGPAPYSTDWSQGGPLIHKHAVALEPADKYAEYGNDWMAEMVGHDSDLYVEAGPTPLIAACRAIVAANLGDEVQIPAELLP
ncbi:hypothetical protein HNP29_000441 [Pseudomonas alcaligenes]|nr:hypothetical protein [Pseudomonas alcaligenes]